MGRKAAARASASSAAAAANGAAPAFTSFAAATAHALGSYSRGSAASSQTAASTLHAPSHWDSDALQLLKKLSKRDATTKLRALQELSAHVGSLQQLQGGVGSIFVSAWGEAFRSAVLDDDSPSVRVALLELMQLVVAKFRRLVQPIFPIILPAWVAAQGDLTASVSESAADTLSKALASAAQRTKVVDRYGNDLRSFCNEIISALPSGEKNEEFLPNALRVIAVLSWLVNTAGTAAAVSPVIDNPSKPLMLLARGPKSKKKGPSATFEVGAARQVCELCMNVIKHMVNGDAADEKRARSFADIALLGVRNKEPVAWSLLLVLLRARCYNAFQNDFEQLAEAVGDAVTATFPSGLPALLPVFDALPAARDESMLFAERVLTRMQRKLHAGLDGQDDEQPSSKVHPATSSYIMMVLPAYVETIAFAHSRGSKRWLCKSDTQRQKEYCTSVASRHILPTLGFFLSGKLPPVPKSQQRSSAGYANFRRSTGPRSSSGVYAGIATSLAHTIETISHHELFGSLPSIAASFVTALNARSFGEILMRYELFLESLRSESLRLALSENAFQSIKQSQSKSVEFGLLALSSTLSKGVRRSSISPGGGEVGSDGEDLTKDVLAYVTMVLKNSKSRIGSEGGETFARTLGELFSWVYWSGNILRADEVMEEVCTSVSETVEDEQRWLLWSEILDAHRLRRNGEAGAAWAPIRGRRIEEQVLECLTSTQAAPYGEQAARFITAAVNPSSGADMPLAVLRRVAEFVSGNWKSEGVFGDDRYDAVAIALLDSPLSCHESEASFDGLVECSILRASESENVLSALLVLFEKLSARQVLHHANRMQGLLSDRHRAEGMPMSERTARQAHVFAQLVSAIGETNPATACTICDSVTSWNHPVFVKELFQQVPLPVVFGDGEDLPFRLDHFLDVIQNASSELKSVLLDYSAGLVDERTREMVRLAVKRLLAGEDDSLNAVIERACRDSLADAKSSRMPFEAISTDILDAFPRAIGSSSSSEFERVPGIMAVMVGQTQGRCLDYCKAIVEEAVKLVRRDPFSRKALVSIDVLSASLQFQDGHAHWEFASDRKIPKWLNENITLVLLAIRRSLERTLAASVDQVHALETRAARLLSYAIDCSQKVDLAADDLRFWTLRVRDIFEAFVGDLKEDSDGTGNWERIASASLLGSALTHVQVSGGGLKDSLLDDISHYGAWAAVGLLPMLERNCDRKVFHESAMFRDCFEAIHSLVVTAAEKNTLVTRDGKIPIDVERVYELIPFLSSASDEGRKAALTLLAYSAAIDLPVKVSESFPNDGFGDETEEIDFALSVLPERLRSGLLWHGGFQNGEDVKASFAAEELGYFLSWRLLLDIIRADDHLEGGTLLGDAEEDASLRRVGITFLRANPEIYADFFNRCVEVVVDGNQAERIAAGDGATEALKVEERAAQGAQLVQKQIEEEEGQTADSGDAAVVRPRGMDAEVGRAAGIVFARALQRLPALSRQHVTDRLDRGTALRVESFVRKRISPLLIAAEIRKVKEWGAFGGSSQSVAASSSGGGAVDGEGELHARGSVAGREVWATYTFSDVTLEIGMRLPDVFPLNTVDVEARSRIGMSEARWRKTLLGITTLLRAKDGTLAEAVELWRRNLDKTFQGAEECPICYSVLHLTTAALPKMQCRTCKNLFHADCMCKWFAKSNSSACPLCRSAF